MSPPRRTRQPRSASDASANGPLYLEGLTPAQLAYTIANQAQHQRLCVIATTDGEAETLADDIATLSGHMPLVVPGEEGSPFSLLAAESRVSWSRATLREALLQGRVPQVVVLSAAAAQATWPPSDVYGAARTRIDKGGTIERDRLIEALSTAGYLRVDAIEDEGTFAVRGGIIDVLVPHADAAFARSYRIDLFGDEVASIRLLGDQHASDKREVDSLVIAPIRDVIFSESSVERACAWLDSAREHSNVPSRQLREQREALRAQRYFFGVESLWPALYGEDKSESVLSALAQVTDRFVLTDGHASVALWRRRLQEAVQARQKTLETFGPQVAISSLLLDENQLRDIVSRDQLTWHGPALLQEETPTRLPLGDASALLEALRARRKDANEGSLLGPLVERLRERIERQGRAFLYASHHGAMVRLREALSARGLTVSQLDAPPSLFDEAPSSAHIGICIAPLSSSIEDFQRHTLLLSDSDLFGTERRVRQRGRAPKAKADALSALGELQPKDCVIHESHGVGRYMGLVRLTLDGVDGDFVQLAYADDDKLYVPVFRLSVLHRYHGLHGNAKLDKLGSGKFEKTKRRVRDAVLAMAHGMLALEARRKSQTGFALPAPGERYAQFAASFPFDETPDQARAIEETLADLQKSVPMDRLVCGDVGFGKTEVALRAAFLAAQGGKQVAMLVPTTVLVEQHRETFEARLTPFAINVASLSRFSSEADRREVLQRAKENRVDIVIGTHSLLSQDLHFADLGLLIIDEEQRFGVKHKERLKQLRAHVHVMAMSATPIPRTLHMATSGMRQLSIISTPPTTRTPIKTEVVSFDEEVVQEAIEREMKRGGQSFVVYNRVERIADVEAMVRRRVPDARVLVAHGQMNGKTLSAVMEQFVHRHADVLVCTAIIESGIDIPSVNTMIVLDAHHFGLSQLYQLRGRIGRGRERGYAYLMLPRDVPIEKDVAERMGLLKRFSTLGAGFQVATHDLEMRGAGDLLGKDQSGHIAAVGFALYTQLLNEAMEQARGHNAFEVVEPEIKVPVAAVFPERYMREAIDRLTFYQRMAAAETDMGIWDVLGEIASLFGPPPPEAESLAELMVLRRRLRELGVSTLSAAMDAEALKVGVSFVPSAAVDRQGVVELCQQQPDAYRALPSGRLAIRLPLPPLQPADPDRGHDMDYVLGADLLSSIRRGLSPLTLRQP